MEDVSFRGFCSHKVSFLFAAQATDGLEYGWDFMHEHYEVTGYSGSATQIYIPAVADDTPIDVIASSAFSFNTYLVDVTIENGVAEIGMSAFSYCTNLVTVNIPVSITTIGAMAFAGCSKLTEIIIPTGVTLISSNVFVSSKLKSVFYCGTQEDWNAITCGGDIQMSKATKYFYSATKPTEEGNYWHWVDGVPTVWENE